MTYSQFLESLISPIESFITWLGTISDSLLSNYIFLTIFGMSLFAFLISFTFNLVRDFKVRSRDKDSKYN